MMQYFKVPKKIIIGEDILNGKQDLFSEYGNKALIVTGPHVAKSDMMNKLIKQLLIECISYEIFDEITSEPTDLMVSKGSMIYEETDCKFVIGLGGGSPLDAAKAIAAMITNPGLITDYNGKTIVVATPPVIAIPTTTGTGSEATQYALITDTRSKIKMLIKGDVMLPTVALVDYTFSMNAPQSVTTATALDALTHSIEAYISKKAMPLTDPLAISAIKRIVKWLPIVAVEGTSKESAKELSLAALEAGICINNSSVTIVHGMSRPIGAMFHVPHGLSNAMLLKVVIADMLDHARQKYAEIAYAIGFPTTKPESEAAQYFVDKVGDICDVCQVPRLSTYGIDRDTFFNAIPKMSADAIASGSPANAPKLYTEADCARLYEQAF